MRSDPTPELFTTILELVRPVGTYLYGRRLYETMAVWEAAHLDSAAPAPSNTQFIIIKLYKII